MGLFDRLKNVASGAMSNAVGDLERSNPEAVYEAAINNALARMDQHKDAAAGLAAQRNRLLEKIEAKERELKQVGLALSEAMDEDDADTAVVLLARKDEVVAEVEALGREHAQVDAAVEETKRGLSQLRTDIQELKREKETALAQFHAAEASIEVHEAASSVSMDANARGLESVRSGIGVLEAQAHEGWRDEEGNSVRGKAAALGKKAKEASARAQLERMKRAARGESEPAEASTSESSDDAENAAEEPAPTTPKRRL